MSTTRTRVIGTTRLLEPVGKGGMAEVFRGVQETLQREVAVKVMLPEITRDKEAVTRFRREALALAGLHHENIVAIHDMVEKNGQLFMVMEYIEGIDVSDLLRKGPLPFDIALMIAYGVGSALEHAHFRKVIHRDVKPSNILISRAGEVKLTDFGIAKDLTIDDLTKTGLVIGTPAYLSPEQVTGSRPDNRTDIYSLGVVLFQLLTGQKPFKATNHGELFIAIAKGDRAKVRQLNSDVPRAIEKIVDKCLAVRPEKRYRRASELCWALDERIASLVKGTPSARMVRYLKELGHVHEDDLSALDLDDEWYDGDGSSIAIELGTQYEVAEEEEEEEYEEEEDGTEDPSEASELLDVSIQLETLRTRVRRTVRLGLLLLILGAVSLAASFNFAPEGTSRTLKAVGTWVDDLATWVASSREAASKSEIGPDQSRDPEDPPSST